ncbi:FGGY-family carbohydrate kinase [Actinomycetes bacterium KLBMP 9797]
MGLTYLLGIDAGQTATKAVLFDATGNVVAVGRADNEVATPHPGWQERDMRALWRQAATAIARCLATAGATGRDVAAIGLCGHNDGVYPVDAAGEPVRAAILATDSRARDYVDRYRTDGTADKALPLTGQSPFAGSPASVYAWLRDHEPHTLERARWLLFCKDWLRLCLTGEAATDPTDASASFTNVHTQQYSPEALTLYGFSDLADRLPAMLAPAALAGRVTAAAAKETGLAAGTPVVTGAHDVDAAALGVGAVHPGAVSIVMGTFAINQVVSDEIRLDHRWQARSFLDRNRWLHMSTSPSSASNLDWAVRLLGPHDPAGRPDFAAAVTEGFTIPAASAPQFLPFLYGSAHGAVGAAFAAMRAGHRRAHLLRAVFDGVVFSHRTHLDALRSQFPLAGPARLCGGGAHSAQWSQLLADVTGLDIETTDTDEASARGAAILAGLGIDWYASLDEAVHATVRNARRHEPNPSAELEDKYHGYLDLAGKLLP